MPKLLILVCVLLGCGATKKQHPGLFVPFDSAGRDPLLPTQSRISRHALLVLRTGDRKARFKGALSIVKRNGGYVPQFRVEERHTLLIARVPPAQLDKTLQQLSALGTLMKYSAGCIDHTEGYSKDVIRLRQLQKERVEPARGAFQGRREMKLVAARIKQREDALRHATVRVSLGAPDPPLWLLGLHPRMGRCDKPPP